MTTLCNSPEAHRQAARLVWQSPEKWTADTVSNALVVALAESRETTDAACQLAERQRAQVKEMSESLAKAERDEAAVRNRFRKVLHSLDGYVTEMLARLNGEPGEAFPVLVADMAERIKEEIRGLHP